jgi:phenylacetate-CoA ligase
MASDTPWRPRCISGGSGDALTRRRDSQISMPDLLHPDIETQTPANLRRHQEGQWPRQWDYVRERSEFYRRKLGKAAGGGPTLDGLQDLPFTDKEELKDSQAGHPPFGDYVACTPEEIVRLHRTSGTTGRGMNLAYTKHDAALAARLGGRAMYAAGLRPGDRVVHCLNYCLWTGGVTDHMILEAAGATVIPFGVGNTRQLIDAILELKATAIHCTPSYPALIEKTLAEEGKVRPRDLGLRLGLFAGEAGLDNPQFRRQLEETWGFAARNANFGLSEVMSILGSQCEATNDLHFHAGDAVFVELLDPATLQRLPIAEGNAGELVCTHLDKQCQPLIRYRTRDVITVTGTNRCECGRTAWRFRITGRTDDMFNVRGVNVFPGAVRAVIAERADLASGQFRIHLRGPGPYDRIELSVEAAKPLPPERWPEAAATLAEAIKRQLRAGAAVSMVAFGSLPRTAGKTVWIERSSS